MEAELLRLGVQGVVPVRWELSKSDDHGTLTGWASVYNSVDQQDDVVVRGAFTKSLAEWKTSKRVVQLTMDHENGVRGTIGSMQDAQDTPYGLKTTFKFASTQDAQNARTLAREGHVNGLSIFGAIVNKSIEMVDSRPVRVLREVALMSVGLTPLPAHTKALVTKAGSLLSIEDTDEELPDVWVSDMRAALGITSVRVRSVAVKTLVMDQFGQTVPGNSSTEEGTQPDGEPVPSHDNGASTFALDLINGPASGSPGSEPDTDSLAEHLLASVDLATHTAGLASLEDELRSM